MYLVRDKLADDRRIALKALRPETAATMELDSLRREFESLTRFRHPNLAQVYDFGRLDESGSCFFTMELVEGGDLFEATENVPLAELCDLFAQVCRALDYLHGRGFVHRDLKPSNIAVTRDAAGSPIVKLLDFGMLSAAGADGGGRRSVRGGGARRR